MAYIRKYTEGYVCRSGKKVSVFGMLKGLLSSPDYKLKDFSAVMINGYMKNSSLINELLDIDLSGVLSGIKIPYKIIQGDTDIVTSTKAIEKYVSQSENANIKLTVIKNSGHMPGEEAMESIIGEIIKMSKS